MPVLQNKQVMNIRPKRSYATQITENQLDNCYPYPCYVLFLTCERQGGWNTILSIISVHPILCHLSQNYDMNQWCHHFTFSVNFDSVKLLMTGLFQQHHFDMTGLFQQRHFDGIFQYKSSD